MSRVYLHNFPVWKNWYLEVSKWKNNYSSSQQYPGANKVLFEQTELEPRDLFLSVQYLRKKNVSPQKCSLWNEYTSNYSSLQIVTLSLKYLLWGTDDLWWCSVDLVGIGFSNYTPQSKFGNIYESHRLSIYLSVCHTFLVSAAYPKPVKGFWWNLVGRLGIICRSAWRNIITIEGLIQITGFIW